MADQFADTANPPLGHHHPLGSNSILGGTPQRQLLGARSLTVLDLSTFFPYGIPDFDHDSAADEPSNSEASRPSANASAEATVQRSVDSEVDIRQAAKGTVGHIQDETSGAIAEVQKTNLSSQSPTPSRTTESSPNTATNLPASSPPTGHELSSPPNSSSVDSIPLIQRRTEPTSFHAGTLQSSTHLPAESSTADPAPLTSQPSTPSNFAFQSPNPAISSANLEAIAQSVDAPQAHTSPTPNLDSGIPFVTPVPDPPSLATPENFLSQKEDGAIEQVSFPHLSDTTSQSRDGQQSTNSTSAEPITSKNSTNSTSARSITSENRSTLVNESADQSTDSLLKEVSPPIQRSTISTDIPSEPTSSIISDITLDHTSAIAATNLETIAQESIHSAPEQIFKASIDQRSSPTVGLSSSATSFAEASSSAKDGANRELPTDPVQSSSITASNSSGEPPLTSNPIASASSSQTTNLTASSTQGSHSHPLQEVPLQSSFATAETISRQIDPGSTLHDSASVEAFSDISSISQEDHTLVAEEIPEDAIAPSTEPSPSSSSSAQSFTHSAESPKPESPRPESPSLGLSSTVSPLATPKLVDLEDPKNLVSKTAFSPTPDQVSRIQKSGETLLPSTTPRPPLDVRSHDTIPAEQESTTSQPNSITHGSISSAPEQISKVPEALVQESPIPESSPNQLSPDLATSSLPVPSASDRAHAISKHPETVHDTATQPTIPTLETSSSTQDINPSPADLSASLPTSLTPEATLQRKVENEVRSNSTASYLPLSDKASDLPKPLASPLPITIQDSANPAPAPPAFNTNPVSGNSSKPPVSDATNHLRNNSLPSNLGSNESAPHKSSALSAPDITAFQSEQIARSPIPEPPSPSSELGKISPALPEPSFETHHLPISASEDSTSQAEVSPSPVLPVQLSAEIDSASLPFSSQQVTPFIENNENSQDKNFPENSQQSKIQRQPETIPATPEVFPVPSISSGDSSDRLSPLMPHHADISAEQMPAEVELIQRSRNVAAPDINSADSSSEAFQSSAQSHIPFVSPESSSSLSEEFTSKSDSLPPHHVADAASISSQVFTNASSSHLDSHTLQRSEAASALEVPQPQATSLSVNESRSSISSEELLNSASLPEHKPSPAVQEISSSDSLPTLQARHSESLEHPNSSVLPSSDPLSTVPKPTNFVANQANPSADFPFEQESQQPTANLTDTTSPDTVEPRPNLIQEFSERGSELPTESINPISDGVGQSLQAFSDIPEGISHSRSSGVSHTAFQVPADSTNLPSQETLTEPTSLHLEPPPGAAPLGQPTKPQPLQLETTSERSPTPESGSTVQRQPSSTDEISKQSVNFQPHFNPATKDQQSQSPQTPSSDFQTDGEVTSFTNSSATVPEPQFDQGQTFLDLPHVQRQSASVNLEEVGSNSEVTQVQTRANNREVGSNSEAIQAQLHAGDEEVNSNNDREVSSNSEVTQVQTRVNDGEVPHSVALHGQAISEVNSPTEVPYTTEHHPGTEPPPVQRQPLVDHFGEAGADITSDLSGLTSTTERVSSPSVQQQQEHEQPHFLPTEEPQPGHISIGPHIGSGEPHAQPYVQRQPQPTQPQASLERSPTFGLEASETPSQQPFGQSSDRPENFSLQAPSSFAVDAPVSTTDTPPIRRTEAGFDQVEISTERSPLPIPLVTNDDEPASTVQRTEQNFPSVTNDDEPASTVQRTEQNFSSTHTNSPAIAKPTSEPPPSSDLAHAKAAYENIQLPLQLPSTQSSLPQQPPAPINQEPTPSLQKAVDTTQPPDRSPTLVNPASLAANPTDNATADSATADNATADRKTVDSSNLASPFPTQVDTHTSESSQPEPVLQRTIQPIGILQSLASKPLFHKEDSETPATNLTDGTHSPPMIQAKAIAASVTEPQATASTSSTDSQSPESFSLEQPPLPSPGLDPQIPDQWTSLADLLTASSTQTPRSSSPAPLSSTPITSLANPSPTNPTPQVQAKTVQPAPKVVSSSAARPNSTVSAFSPTSTSTRPRLSVRRDRPIHRDRPPLQAKLISPQTAKPMAVQHIQAFQDEPFTTITSEPTLPAKLESLERLAQEIYHLLRQRLAVENERHGRVYPKRFR